MKFLLISTGGTIASVSSEKGLVPALTGEQLLEFCPLLMGFEHDLEITDLFSKDSSNINPHDWLNMAKSVRSSGADAVILLHGTDTVAWTAAALSYLLSDVEIPIVLTGSMMPPGEPGSDAPDNIFAAFQFALQLAMYKRKGVSIAFADTLIHGPKTAKIDSRRKKAFVSVDYPILGEMMDKGSHKVAWLTPHFPKFQGGGPWSGTPEPELETNIALVPIFPGMKAAWLDAVTAAAPKAVVLEGFGLGGVPYMGENLLGPIKNGLSSGIPFILRSQSPFGGTDASIYEVGRKAVDLGVISAQGMTREALLVKLMLLLPVLGGKNLKESLCFNLCDDV
ncbi:MAG: asparaginase [Synergistaceae bacterium]|nr:asparaginase [Synergistaceae bacterium]